MNPFDPNNLLQPKKGMTSVQAAELYLQDQDNKERLFKFKSAMEADAEQRARLSAMMGFAYEVTIKNNRFICKDLETGYKTTAFYDDMNEKAVKRLVRALMRLKKVHDTPKV